MNKKSIKRLRFEKVAAKRVQKLLNMLDLLGNCSNQSNYEYNQDDVRKMFTALENRIKYIKTLYGNTYTEDKNNFKF